MTEITCPSCKATNASWQVYEMTGEGDIFFTEKEDPKVKDFTPSHICVGCPNCGYTIEGNIHLVRNKLMHK